MKQQNTIFDFFLDTCEKYSDRIAFVERKKYRRKTWTYQEVKNKVFKVSKFLENKHLAKGDKIIVCSPNNAWWVFLYFACANKGIILVPLDSNSSIEFLKKITLLTEAKYIFFSKYLLQALTDFPAPKIFIEDLLTLTEKLSSSDSAPAPHIQATDTLEIVFSSGSTGEPKGVILTNRNICSNLYSLASMVPITQERRFLSIVPLSHMLEQTAGLLSPMLWGASIIYPYTNKPRIILQTLREEKITSIICVPAFLQILRNSVMKKIESLGQSANFDTKLSSIAKLPAVIRRLFSHQIRKNLGRALKEFYVGGAPLDSYTEDFWNKLGIPVLQGYGMTEASPLVATNSRRIHRSRSVGKILPDVSVKLSSDGEILIKGSNVSNGYFQNREATKESFEDGWLKSGDIGEFDQDSFLFVRGRKKNTIIGPSGMKIYPEDIEEVLRNNPAIKDAVVCGVEQNSNLIIIAAVILNKDTSPKEISDKANGRLASHQKIQEVITWPEQDFPRTPTKKIIRTEVCEYLKSGQKTATRNNADNKTTDTLTKIVSEVTGNPVGAILPEANFVTDLKLDSIKRLELVSRIEEEYCIELDESNITHKFTVQNLREVIGKTSYGQKEMALPKWPISKPVVYLRMFLQLLLFYLLKTFQSVKTNFYEKKYPRLAIFIANHQSHLDTVNILEILPRKYRRYMAIAAAKDYFFSNRFGAFWSRLIFNAFPLDREGNIRESLKNIGKLLDNGWSVLIFPEGTRTKTGEIQSFKNGIGVIAQEMEVPIIPIKISGNFEILPKGKVFPKAGKTYIGVGGPIMFPSNFSYIQITKRLEEILKNL